MPDGARPAGASAPPEICLVAMPFLPVLSPSLGLSALKAELAAAGIGADLVYPSLRLLHRLAALGNADTAEFDYKLMASSTDLGETVFAAALWDDPALEQPAVEAIAQLLGAAGTVIDGEAVSASVARLLTLPSQGTAFIEEVLDGHDWGRYRIVGFSSVFSQSAASLALARRIKARYPGVTILFGGPNVDGDMGHATMRAFPFVDAVLRGEADISLPRFAMAGDAGALDRIPGLIYRSGGELRCGPPARPVQDLDARPIPDFSDYFAQVDALDDDTVARDRITLPLETSRGCWWGAVRHCIFCGLNPTTMAFRSKSPGRAIAEFDALAERWRIGRFFAVDNIIDMSYFGAVLPALEVRGYTIFYETKSNLKEAHVAQFARAGVCNIQPGIEGLNSEILALMSKGAKGVRGVELLKWCRLHRVDPLWFYLYGFPGERAAPYLADIDLMPLLWHLPPPRNANPIILDRYSPLFRDREAYGMGELRPSRNTAIYLSGLDAELRRDLSYHFDNRPPDAATPLYEDRLWQAVMLWRRRAAEGAFLCHLQGRHATLVIDGRAAGGCATWLLTGSAHALLAALRTGRRVASLSLPPVAAPAAEDLELSLAAGALDADIVDADTVAAAWSALSERKLAVAMDGLGLALSVDLVPGDLAVSLGLDHLVRRPARAGAVPAAGAEAAYA